MSLLTPVGLRGAIALAAALSSGLLSSLISSPARAESLKSSGEIGLSFGIVPGVAGEAANPGLQITPGLSFAIGEKVRYHLTFGYSHMTVSNGFSSSGVNGFDLRPLTLGFPIHVGSTDSVGFAIEPLVDAIGMHAYFGNGAALYLFSSGFGVQGVMNFHGGYISIAPLNFQFQYAVVAAGGGSSASGTGFGLNMPIRLSGGLRF